MTPLARRLARLIAQAGPLPVDEVMRTALLDPKDGYYATKTNFAAPGGMDFLTAPETSQMFGECLGVWARLWFEQAGWPKAFDLIELGPGRGVLMRDLLAAADRDAHFRSARRVVLVEASEKLRAVQAETLAGLEPVLTDRLPQTGAGPALILGNEFLDCLGVRQVLRAQDGWRERLIGLDEAGGLRFVLGGPAPTSLIPPRLRDAPEGALAETSPALAGWMAALGARLQAAGGAALFLDYGPARSEAGDTLQAIRGHRKVDPLTTLGEADLTARVDFEAVAAASEAAGLAAHGPVEQGRFLVALGIEARARALAGAHPERADMLARQLQRLAAPDQMGSLFKAICLTPVGAPPPPVFDAFASPANQPSET